ncbi:helix-turn-helix domain-containing protein [Pseudochrobactrum sp. B5]|uniref:helix-turn-helix transcriptional regulator n=1 Tax=Pseudochrobactrum sp. B5 TaxID=1289478 RepID=UPI0009513FC8|nr:helix-turn-helix domain-containing protein [Pseudochrobactrum sp. B5]
MNKRNLDPKFIARLDVMDAVEAAIYLRTSTSTLAKYRMYGDGPTFIRQSSRKTLYRKTDLDAWLASNVAA